MKSVRSSVVGRAPGGVEGELLLPLLFIIFSAELAILAIWLRFMLLARENEARFSAVVKVDVNQCGDDVSCQRKQAGEGVCCEGMKNEVRQN